MLKRTIAITMVLLVGLPWSALPSVAGSACGPRDLDASESCSFCSSDGSTTVTESLRPGCCRFTPRAEAAPIQAAGVSSSPSPHQTPCTPAAPADFATDDVDGCLRGDLAARPLTPIHAPTTATTHLLI